MRVAAVLLGAVLAVFLGYVVYQRLFVTEEMRVKKVLDGLESSLEDHKPLRFGKYISSDYKDAWGNRKQDMNVVVLHGMREFETITVEPEDVTIEVTGENAVVTFRPRCVVTSKSYAGLDLDQEILAGRSLRLTLKRKDRKWLVTGAEPCDVEEQ